MVLRFNRGTNSSIGTERLVLGDDDRHIGGTSNHSLNNFYLLVPAGIQLIALRVFFCMKRYIFESLVLF